MWLQSLLLQFFYIIVYAMQFLGNIDALRAMRAALVAPRAMIGLAQLGDTPIVAHQINPPGLPVIILIRA